MNLTYGRSNIRLSDRIGLGVFKFTDFQKQIKTSLNEVKKTATKFISELNNPNLSIESDFVVINAQGLKIELLISSKISLFDISKEIEETAKKLKIKT